MMGGEKTDLAAELWGGGGGGGVKITKSAPVSISHSSPRIGTAEEVYDYARPVVAVLYQRCGKEQSTSRATIMFMYPLRLSSRCCLLCGQQAEQP